jgi:plastocyanin
MSTGALLASSANAQITGTVKLDGEAPEPAKIEMAADAKCAAAHTKPVLDESIVAGDKGELANVVVNVKSPEGKPLKGDVPKDPVVIDQKGCQYSPHVVAMMVGQEWVVKNSDPFMHNVHSIALDNDQFNLSQSTKGAENKVGNKVKVPERFTVKCDVHPWMNAQVNAFEHPFFAVSNEKGEFSIPTKGLADGKYTIEIWHEKLAPEPMTHEIEVKDGKAKVEEIKIPAAAAKASADNANANVKLASAEEKACKASGGACCAAKSKAQAIASAAAAKK